MRPLRVTTVGHVTNDRLAEGTHAGGAALYAGLAALALGAEVTLVTRAGQDFVGRQLLDRFHHLHALAAPLTTCFDERHRDGRRTVRLHALAGPVDAALPPADVTLLCPVANEVSRTALLAPSARFLAAGLQGWLRAFARDGTAAPRALVDPSDFSGCGLVACSSEDLDGLGPETLTALRAIVPRVAITEGRAGARIHAGREGWRVAALPVEEVDPTGAGDVFLAVLAVQLARGAPLREAAVWAACAGALAVTATGPGAVETLSQLPTALERYRREVPPPRPLSAGE
jgi:1D-myo-inositol 3-kinase